MRLLSLFLCVPPESMPSNYVHYQCSRDAGQILEGGGFSVGSAGIVRTKTGFHQGLLDEERDGLRAVSGSPLDNFCADSKYFS